MDEGKSVTAGRAAARALLEGGKAARPPQGVSWLAVVRGYADLLTLAVLSRIEDLLRDPSLDPKLLVVFLEKLSDLQAKVRSRVRRKAKPPAEAQDRQPQPPAGAGAAAPFTFTTVRGPLRSISAEALERFDEKFGIAGSPGEADGADRPGG